VIASIQPGQPVIHSVEVADTQPSHEQNMIEEARIQGRKNRFLETMVKATTLAKLLPTG